MVVVGGFLLGGLRAVRLSDTGAKQIAAPESVEVDFRGTRVVGMFDHVKRPFLDTEAQVPRYLNYEVIG